MLFSARYSTAVATLSFLGQPCRSSASDTRLQRCNYTLGCGFVAQCTHIHDASNVARVTCESDATGVCKYHVAGYVGLALYNGARRCRRKKVPPPEFSFDNFANRIGQGLADSVFVATGEAHHLSNVC